MINMIKKIKNWFEDGFLTEHISIGNLTIYGRNAMHWGVNFWTKKYGYICFRLPFRCFGKWWPLYFYCSPNGTPWAATFMLGKKHSRSDWVKSRIRYSCLGHNFKVHGYNEIYECENYEILRGIYRMVDDSCHAYWKYQQEHPEED